MAKQSRKERKEEERRLLAELDAEVMGAKSGEGYAVDENGVPYEVCPRCRSAAKDGKCSVCGYREYQPISGKTRKTIRIVVGAILVGVFLAIFFGPKLFG